MAGSVPRAVEWDRLMVFENKMQQRRGGFSPPHRLDHGEGRGKPAPTLLHFIFKDHQSRDHERIRAQSQQRRLNLLIRLNRRCPYTSASISSIVAASRSASVSEKGIGGLILITLWKGPSVPSKIPASRKRSEMNEASSVAGSSVSRSRTSSMPRNNPEPRTSPTISWRSARFRKPSSNRPPTRRACDCRPSSSVTASVSSPTAHDTVLPPKVLKNSMPLANEAAISDVVTTAPIGWPLPIGLPSTTISGTTSS